MDTTVPYECAWTPTVEANYTLTAQATDNQAATTTSPPTKVKGLNVGSKLPPEVLISQPSNNALLPANSALLIRADALDNDGSVTQVTFFANGNVLCVDTAAPFECEWTPAVGDYTLTAVATDNDAIVVTSPVVPVKVVGSVGQPPTVVIQSPTAETCHKAGSALLITASATDVDGSVVQVIFFANDVAITGCVDITAPYECLWTPTAQPYALRAEATDDQGNIGKSVSVVVIVE